MSTQPHRLDLHVHTTIGSPCAAHNPLDIPRYAKEAGLSGIVVTDHNFGWAENELSPDAYEDLAEAFWACGLVMFIGMEVTTTEGDILVYPPDISGFIDALPDGIGKLDFTVREVMDAAESVGALAALAHPHRYPALPPHAIERFNGARGTFENPYNVPEIGGSDAHFPWGVGAAFTQFDKKIDRIEDLIELVRAGACRPGRREKRPSKGVPAG